MDELLIKGGYPLQGSLRVSGAKNAVLPAMTAAILVPDVTRLENVPDVKDVAIMARLLTQIGASITRQDDVMEIDASGICSCEAPYDLVRTMRASILLLGPLLARLHHARVSLPGGCAIGNRPVDIHLKALEQLGATVSIEHGMIDICGQALLGGDIYLDFPTVTGTENIMMAAVAAQSPTRIMNAAREPEIEDLGRLLNAMGYQVDGAGTETITVHPGGHPRRAVHRIIPDRIEAGTYAMAAAITRGCLTVENVIPRHLISVITKLEHAGLRVSIGSNSITVESGDEIRAIDFTTAVYPGYPTDLQAQMMALMCIADGESLITETIFENRFMHVAELNRMGASISIRGRTAVVRGVESMLGAEVMATDLRASASLVLAGLAAREQTRILRVYHLDRGYDDLVGKLTRVGAHIERIPGR